MKKRYVMMICALAAAALAVGCGAARPDTEMAPAADEAATPEEMPDGETVENTVSETDTSYLEWLPEGVERLNAETAADKGIQDALAEYYEIPEDAWEGTRYYYNYVDLNEDGTDEVFVVAVGSYVSGSGGTSALWLEAEDMSVIQAFTLVNTPIIVSDELVNGYHSLILQGPDGETVVLTNENGVYTNVSDAEPAGDLDGVTGSAIICNDLAGDMETGNYLTLAD